MSWFAKRRSPALPAPERSLPGRPDRMPVPATHAVSGARLEPPFPPATELALFGMGCFWGAERCFWQHQGVYSTSVGYAGGFTPNPTYEEVCTDRTGHAEAVQVTFDPKRVSYAELVRRFFGIHDPTQVDRQGPDHGTQYRSAIFFHGEAQRETARRVMDEVEKSGQYKKRLATELVPASAFYQAEEYHQKYYEKHGVVCY